jgi:hypothetical protein
MSQQEWMDEVGRELVAQLAEEELEDYDMLADEYRRDPGPRRSSTSPAALGFGSGAVEALATPAILGALSAVAGWLLKGVLKPLATEKAQGALRDIFRGEALPPELRPFTAADLKAISQHAAEAAFMQGLDRARAQGVADSLVSRLALSRG